MTTGDAPSMREIRPAPVQPLEYPAPHLSTLDRPVEPIVRAARAVRIAVRITFLVAGALFLAFALWAIYQIDEAFRAVGK